MGHDRGSKVTLKKVLSCGAHLIARDNRGSNRFKPRVAVAFGSYWQFGG